MLALEIDVQGDEGLAHPDRGAHRSHGVVLVEPRDPEDRHHRVTDELLDRAAVALDHGGHLVEVPAHHAAERLGVEPLAERRGPRHVGEDDRDDLPDVGRGGFRLAERRRAVLAEASLVGVLLSAGGTALHERILERARDAPERPGDVIR